jgi:hypothetical protein
MKGISMSGFGFDKKKALPQGKRDYSYYKKLRKENPRLYRDASIQAQMMADAQRMGNEEFFGEGNKAKAEPQSVSDYLSDTDEGDHQ